MEAVIRQRYPNLKEAAQKCKKFMQNFVDVETQELKYMSLLQNIANRQTKALEIHLDDLQAFEHDTMFVKMIVSNAIRYVDIFADCADELLPEPNIDVTWLGDQDDVLHAQRKARLAATRTEDDMKSQFPKALLRRFRVFLLPPTEGVTNKMREIKAEDIGSLVNVKGIVTRVSDVQPLITVAAYTCSICGYENYQTVTDSNYTPLTECPSEVCKANETRGELYHSTRASKFIPFQEVRLQEVPGEVPIGRIPRSVTLRIRGSLTRRCMPGHLITVSGVFLPIKKQGFRGMRAGLTAETYLEVQQIISHKKNYGQFDVSEEMQQEIEDAAESEDVYEALSASIAPEIYGHNNVKKALLLLLVGGVTKKLHDGMRIRGDINVLLMGDPGVAKSQLLKHIAHVAPRGIYTTGKGSSGVGLTAAVIRDPVTSEMTLEGGALVLADKGICCIDEFDKMEENDRTAIHEVMEQQTVSVAKAGITTTLNARTCILAAANPVMGRWNPKLSPEKNLGLAPALLSRFDLTFKILDKPDEDFDRSLAMHVCHVHRLERHPELDFEPYSPAFLRAYISKARTFEPFVPEGLADHIVGLYVGLRKGDQDQDNTKYLDKTTNKRARFCTARTLLSILRLSQALARIRFHQVVSEDHVEEAMNLLVSSKNADDDGVAHRQGPADDTAAVFHIFTDLGVNQRKHHIKVAQARQIAVTRGFSEKAVDAVLEMYENLGVWQVTSNRQEVQFLPGQLNIA